MQPHRPSHPASRPSSPGLDRLSLLDNVGQRLTLHSRKVMVAVSHLLEDHAGLSGPETTLIATFQTLSRYERQAARYRSLAPRVRQIYVVGVPDGQPEPVPGVTLVPIEATWPLAQEWVVLVSGPRCCAALLARDEAGLRMDRLSPSFRGRYTTDSSLVDGAVEAFFGAVGQPAPLVTRDMRGLQANNKLLLKDLERRLRA